MKAVILAGGQGTRISEESILRPKPMIEIGGRPILWHIMKHFAFYGINEFIICCGYKGYMIKEYFSNYFLHMSDVTIDIKNNKVNIHKINAEPWTVTLVDTGEVTMTGGRLKRVRDHLDDNESFFFTYGDGLSDVDLDAERKFHNAHGGLATICAVIPPGRYGAIEMTKGRVTKFTEKPHGDGGYINGGFFIMSPLIIDYIEDDESAWEETSLQALVDNKQLFAYEHRGFWHAMDTLRDKNYLEQLWSSGKAPWKKW